MESEQVARLKSEIFTYLKGAVASLEQNRAYPADVKWAKEYTSEALTRLNALETILQQKKGADFGTPNIGT
jgi:hypothetical protein